LEKYIFKPLDPDHLGEDLLLIRIRHMSSGLGTCSRKTKELFFGGEGNVIKYGTEVEGEEHFLPLARKSASFFLILAVSAPTSLVRTSAFI
jgi:hypothetical protein